MLRVDDVSVRPLDHVTPDFCSLGCARNAVHFAKLLGDPLAAMDRFKKGTAQYYDYMTLYSILQLAQISLLRPLC